MSAKTRRRQIEETLGRDADDSFLRYGMAMEHASAGEDDEAARQLLDLTRRDAGYVPAYLQAGQALVRLGRDDEARAVLRDGIAVATRKGDGHAAGEMAGLLESLGT